MLYTIGEMAKKMNLRHTPNYGPTGYSGRIPFCKKEHAKIDSRSTGS